MNRFLAAVRLCSLVFFWGAELSEGVRGATPTLQIESVDGLTVVVSWPGDTAGFVLEVADILVPASWQATSAQPALANSRFTSTLPLDSKTRFFRLRGPGGPFSINAALAADTGVSDRDGITSAAMIAGEVSDRGAVASLVVGLDGASPAGFISVLDQVNVDGSFVFDAARLDPAGSLLLTDGPHTLHVLARNTAGALLGVATVSFTLDVVNDTFNLYWVKQPKQCDKESDQHYKDRLAEFKRRQLALQLDAGALALDGASLIPGCGIVTGLAGAGAGAYRDAVVGLSPAPSMTRDSLVGAGGVSDFINSRAADGYRKAIEDLRGDKFADAAKNLGRVGKFMKGALGIFAALNALDDYNTLQEDIDAMKLALKDPPGDFSSQAIDSLTGLQEAVTDAKTAIVQGLIEYLEGMIEVFDVSDLKRTDNRILTIPLDDAPYAPAFTAGLAVFATAGDIFVARIVAPDSGSNPRSLSTWCCRAARTSSKAGVSACTPK